MDHAKNTNSTEIYLIKQDWVDWAVEDATGSGPMLVWFSLALLLLVSTSCISIHQILEHKALISTRFEPKPNFLNSLR